jgi:hypothetical protein
MSVHALPESRDTLGVVDGAARHLRVWLGAAGLTYDAVARDLFVRAHPVLFGRECEVALRGYERWRWRHRLHDTAAAFARYMAPRHQRWMSTQHAPGSMAPCLIGRGSALPCWALENRQSDSKQGEELRSAA